MRISDWSSDVCSSDLRAHPFDGLDDVFAAALGYFQGKRRLAVEPREAFRVLEAAAQARDVAKVHYCVATHLDREVDDVLHGLEQAGYLHREAALAGIERAGGDHQVGLGHHLHDVGGVEVVALQSDGIDDDLEQLVAVADNLCLQHAGDALRSEEHTSELQSLMRISYA